jgi:hypothetical protein
MLTIDATARFVLLDELLDTQFLVQRQDHLALVSVRPDRQCRGPGRALFAHHVIRLDRSWLAACLEATMWRPPQTG